MLHGHFKIVQKEAPFYNDPDKLIVDHLRKRGIIKRVQKGGTTFVFTSNPFSRGSVERDWPLFHLVITDYLDAKVNACTLKRRINRRYLNKPLNSGTKLVSLLCSAKKIIIC